MNCSHHMSVSIQTRFIPDFNLCCFIILYQTLAAGWSCKLLAQLRSFFAGLSKFFCLFVLLFQVVNFGFALGCCTLVTVVTELCGDVFPYIVLSSHR